MPVLRIVPPEGEAYEHRFEGSELVIGRSDVCDLVLPDRFLSRRHARLFLRADGLAVEDLGSRNGTLLDGERLTEPRRLREGDILSLSGSRIEILSLGRDGPSGGGGAPARPGSVKRDAASTTVYRSAAEVLELEERAAADGEELRRQAARMRIVNQVHHALAGSISEGELVELILERAFDHLRPEEGVVLLRRPGGRVEPVADRRRPGSEGEPLASRTLVEEVMGRGLSALVLDTASDERFAGADSLLAAGVRSLVAAPLLSPEGPRGLIVLASRLHQRRFDEGDLELLTSVASVAGLRLWSLGLAEEAEERRLMERELALARRIQTALLPESLPEIAGWELRAGNLPSRAVSGDLYLAVPRGDGIALVVADVSGKGIAAALVTVALESLITASVAEGLAPEEILARVSPRLHRRTPPEKFATLFVALLDPGSGVLRYASAGHDPALVLRAGGGGDRLLPTGPPLGLLPGSAWSSRTTELRPGDLLALYTDGITEAVNPAEEELGIERLQEVLRARRRAPLKEVARGVEEELERFADGVPFADDRTLVLARRVRHQGS